MRITVNPLFELIAQGEHQQQDFKYCINDSRKIARSLVAFANTDGGRLLLGVKDNGKIVGVRSDEEYYMVEAAANIYSKPKIAFDVVQWDADGKTVLEIQVKPSKIRPHYAENNEKKWVAYIRKDDENVLANSVLLKSWKINNSKNGLLFTYDNPRKALINYLNENPIITLSKFSKVAQIDRLQAEKILSEFLALGCINIHLEAVPVSYSINVHFDFEKLS
jgi:predicted HTH transcriptional regulator